MKTGDKVAPRGLTLYHSDHAVVSSIDPFVSGEPIVWVTQNVAYKQSDIHILKPETVGHPTEGTHLKGTTDERT